MLLTSRTRSIGRRSTAAGPTSLISAITTAGLTSNLKLCLDAGDSSSYTSGQSWLDRSGNGYDFFRGATSAAQASDPTFNGSAGGLSSSEYWSFDGGDYFQYDTANETWMQNLHKDNATFTMMAAIYIPDQSGTTHIWSTSTITGFVWRILNTEKQGLRTTDSSSSELIATVDSAMSTNAWHILGVSLNEATGAGGGFFYKDGAYDQVSSADTFTSTYPSPNTGDAFDVARLGSRDTTENFETGTRFGWFAAWEGTALSKANMDTLYAIVKNRYGLS